MRRDRNLDAHARRQKVSRALLLVGFAGALALAACTPGRDISAPPPGTIMVEMRDNFFQPGTVTVTRGGHVRWTNRGQELHSVTSEAELLRSELITPTSWFEVRFEELGTFEYQCSLHGETGTVIVQ